MLRITVVPSVEGRQILQLSGRIGAAEVALLDGQLRQLDGPRVLDLAGVEFIDEVGLDLLQRWIQGGLRLRGGSPFLRRLLTDHGCLRPTPPSSS